MTLLSVDGLNAWYGRARVLTDVSLCLRAGEAVAVLGRNGAGKSTLFRALMGLIPRRTGSIRFAGRPLTGRPPHEIARLGLGWVPEDRRVFTELTVEENLEVGHRPARPGLTPWTPERLYALFPNLAELRGRPAGRMSGGEQQMLSIARTLMGNPAAVLLDEPSEGLAPRIVEQMARTVSLLKQEGLAILISEQNPHFSRLICSRAYILEIGQVRFSGSMAELDARPDVRDAYLAI